MRTRVLFASALLGLVLPGCVFLHPTHPLSELHPDGVTSVLIYRSPKRDADDRFVFAEPPLMVVTNQADVGALAAAAKGGDFSKTYGGSAPGVFACQFYVSAEGRILASSVVLDDGKMCGVGYVDQVLEKPIVWGRKWYGDAMITRFGENPLLAKKVGALLDQATE